MGVSSRIPRVVSVRELLLDFFLGSQSIFYLNTYSISTVRYSCCLCIARKCIIEKLTATVKDSNGRRRRQPLVSSGRPSAAKEIFLDDFRSLFQSVAFR